MDSTSTPDPLGAGLASPDHLTRLHTLELLDAMARRPDTRPHALQIASDALAHASPTARSAAAQLAGAAGLTELTPRLIGLGLDPHEAGRVRKSAVLALGLLQATDAVPAALALTDHPNPMYRRAAAEALGRIGTPDAATALTAALADPAWEVRMVAAIGLGGPAADAAPAPALQAILLALHAEPHPPTAEQLLRSLAELALRCPEGRTDAAEVLRRALAQPPEGPEAWRLQRAAARGLGELRDTASAPLLEAMEEVTDAVVAEEVRWARRQLSADRC